MSHISTPSIIIRAGPTAAHTLKAKGISATIIDSASHVAEPWHARHPP